MQPFLASPLALSFVDDFNDDVGLAPDDLPDSWLCWRFRWRPFILLVLSNPVVNTVFKWKCNLIHIFKPLIISVLFLLWQQFAAVLLMYFCQQFKNVINLSQVLFHHCQILLWVQQAIYYAWISHQSFMQLTSSIHKNWSLTLQSFLSVFSGILAISSFIFRSVLHKLVTSCLINYHIFIYAGEIIHTSIQSFTDWHLFDQIC